MRVILIRVIKYWHSSQNCCTSMGWCSIINQISSMKAGLLQLAHTDNQFAIECQMASRWEHLCSARFTLTLQQAMTSIIHIWQRRSWLLTTMSDQPLKTPCRWSRLNPTSKAACVCSQQGPTSCHKIMVSSTFHQIQTFFLNWNVLYAVLFEKQMYNSGNFNGKNWWIIKKVTVLKKLLPHLTTRGTYSPGDWRCNEAWREETLVYPPVMCLQRLIYCTWELNVM